MLITLIHMICLIIIKFEIATRFPTTWCNEGIKYSLPWNVIHCFTSIMNSIASLSNNYLSQGYLHNIHDWCWMKNFTGMWNWQKRAVNSTMMILAMPGDHPTNAKHLSHSWWTSFQEVSCLSLLVGTSKRNVDNGSQKVTKQTHCKVPRIQVVHLNFFQSRAAMYTDQYQGSKMQA